jgi:BNR repeat-containing family member
MKFFSSILSAFIICTTVSVTAHAQEVRQSSFTIPPNGKPDALIGGIDFEAPGALAFDSLNRPYMFHTREPKSYGHIITLREGKWIHLPYMDTLRKVYPQLQLSLKRQLHEPGSIAIDNNDNLYAVLRVTKSSRRTRDVLLYSPDLGRHFTVHELPGRAFLEIRTGHNLADCPPAIGCLVLRKKHPAEWTNYHNLQVFLPTIENDQLMLADPITVSTNCFGVSNHSGGYSFAATTGSKTHVVYADIPKDNRGNPTYAATIDRKQRRVIARQFLVNAPPKKPDVHSTPVIAMDSTHHLHVLAGAHCQSFFYLRSIKPDTVEGGWTKPLPQGQRQTYATLVCDSKDQLHSIYRVHPRLMYQHKAAGANKWSSREVLVHPPKGHKGYSIFYHRLFIDRADALYLSFTFFENRPKNNGIYPRALAVSEDGGKSWSLATTDIFQRRIAKETKDAPEVR